MFHSFSIVEPVFPPFSADLPTFNNTNPTEITPNKGSTVTITCQAKANPPPTSITWYKDDVPLSITGRYSGGTLSNPDLIIANLNGSESGSYYCGITNGLGSRNNTPTDVDVQCECHYHTVLVFMNVCMYSHCYARLLQLLLSNLLLGIIEWMNKGSQTNAYP